ncbi:MULTISPECIES: hypothetical protein [Streptomyces]|uniref:hypothetical protein n=1 Tax=Streptomyces TaxID=1883 RepID=UPI0013A534BC|nr:hypothetical protein [Streptomyces sp. CS081A]
MHDGSCRERGCGCGCVHGCGYGRADGGYDDRAVAVVRLRHGNDPPDGTSGGEA